MLIHPSSGACDLFVELFHGLYCSGSMCVGVTLWFGWGGVASVCSSASACIRIPHHHSQTTTQHQHTSNQSNTTHEITQQISRKLLRMDVLTSETCWALNNEIIKQVTSSWSLFIQLNMNCQTQSLRTTSFLLSPTAYVTHSQIPSTPGGLLLYVVTRGDPLQCWIWLEWCSGFLLNGRTRNTVHKIGYRDWCVVKLIHLVLSPPSDVTNLNVRVCVGGRIGANVCTYSLLSSRKVRSSSKHLQFLIV